jgi:hypothetical protein
LLASSSQHDGSERERERKEENQTVERTGSSKSGSPAYTLSAVNNKIDCSDKRKPIICINLASGEILKCAAVSYINAVRLNILSSLEINEKPNTGYVSETNSVNDRKSFTTNV